MPRGLLTAALILIALACIAFSRRLDRERRLIAHFRARQAVDAAGALPLARMTDDERDTAGRLLDSGLLQPAGDGCFLAADELGAFKRKRLRTAAAGAAVALALASLAVFALDNL